MKNIYISGPITGRADAMQRFAKMEIDLTARGFTALNPARLPGGLTSAQYMRIDFAMIDAADAVILLPRWMDSPGSRLEVDYCRYTGKPVFFSLEGLIEGALLNRKEGKHEQTSES